MKSALVLAVILGAAFGAPTKNIGKVLRTKKSPSYGPPCGAAPVALYLTQGPQLQHYRENDIQENKEHEKARSYYDSPAGVAAPGLAGLVGPVTGGQVPTAAPSAPAVGLFPNAKVGGCAVPLLLSCAPNVVSGHLAHHAAAGGAYHGGYGSPTVIGPLAAYRADHDLDHEHKMREVVQEKTWSESERSNLQVPADNHEALASNQLSPTTSFHQPAHPLNMKH